MGLLFVLSIKCSVEGVEMKSVYLACNDVKVAMLVRTPNDKVVMILPDLNGTCQDGFVLVEDVKTGKRHQQNAYYLRPVKT